MRIKTATLRELPRLFPLFDAYRCFYGMPSDPAGARRFLRQRITRKESVIFLAMAGSLAVGFTQLYPSFSSTGMRRIFVLNDLFVAPGSRKMGVGAALMETARKFAISKGARRMVLSTAKTNRVAQSLYRRCGYLPERQFMNFKIELD